MTRASNGSGLEETRKRSFENESSGTEPKRYNAGGNEPLLKLLVPNIAVGALIGKGGALINELKSTCGGNIRISAGREFYPGTQERVVVLTGEIDQINDLNNHIMENVKEKMKSVPSDGNNVNNVKIVLTNEAAGLLIGHGGATIKSIKEESKARLSISMPDKSSVPGERVLTISGSFDERSEGCRQVVQIIANDCSNMGNTKLRYMSGNMDTNVGNIGFNSMGAGYGGVTAQHQRGNDTGGLSYQSSGSALKANVEVTIEVPDILVGPLMGKQGSIIKDFVQRSGGARFKFSDKSESADRTLTISGNMDQAYSAYNLVNQRVVQLGNLPQSQGF